MLPPATSLLPLEFQVHGPAAEITQAMALHEECVNLLSLHPTHPVMPDFPLRHVEDAFRALDMQWVRELQVEMKKRLKTITLMREDPFHHGWLSRKWERDFHMETLRLRLANPNVVITRHAWGGNGSGKTVGAAFITAHFAVNSRPVDGMRQLIWCYSLNQANSQELQQTNIYDQFPREYRDESGKPFKRNAKAGMTFSAGKFTDNVFMLPNQTKCEFRFYGDNSDIRRAAEGPRPTFCWSDEEIPQPWVEAINSRLLTAAGKTSRWQHRWSVLLAQMKRDPEMIFPVDQLQDLYMGVHLITFTCKNGFTPAVRAVASGATIVRKITAELLPLKTGNGFEEVPELLWAKDGKTSATTFFPWENPFGGNWEGMKSELKNASRETILWKAYGWAEGTTNVVLTNWDRAAHLRPETRLQKTGTWYHVADPTDAKRNWFMKWFKIDHEQITFLAREWPQEDDYVPGRGFLGPWAVPSKGKKFDGDRGPAQKRVIHSFAGYACEIERVEQGLENLERRLHGRSDIADRRSVIRIMDARFANTESMSHSDSETAIEAMEKHGYYFLPSGKGGGGEANIRTIKDRTQFVLDLLEFDKTKAVLDEKTGLYTFHGKAPLFYVCDRCTNTIFTNETWTNEDGGEGACKDPADVDGYYATCRPYHRTRPERTAGNTGGVRDLY